MKAPLCILILPDSPYAPLSVQDMKDTSIRFPWWAQVRRPSVTGDRNPVRIPAGQKPEGPARSSDRLELEAETGPGVPTSPDVPRARQPETSSVARAARGRPAEIAPSPQPGLLKRLLTGRLFAGAARRAFGKRRKR